MIWIEVTDTENVKHIINLNNVMDVQYLEETDLTIVSYNRAAYPSVYLKGNRLKTIKSSLTAGEHHVYRIGD